MKWNKLLIKKEVFYSILIQLCQIFSKKLKERIDCCKQTIKYGFNQNIFEFKIPYYFDIQIFEYNKLGDFLEPK